MATPVPATIPTKAAAQSSSLPAICLVAGWLIPGAGHLILHKPVRAALLFVSITGMFFTGIALQGKIYQPGGELLDILGFVGQLGNGVLVLLAHLLDWGKPTVLTALADYGTKFIVIAGLLNVVAAVDAHSLASGRKAS
jgi:hypothetical protein